MFTYEGATEVAGTVALTYTKLIEAKLYVFDVFRTLIVCSPAVLNPPVQLMVCQFPQPPVFGTVAVANI